MADFDAGRASDAIDAWRARVGGDAVYLTIDVDCIDPAFAPGTGTPMCGGFGSREIMNLLRGFQGIQIAGADVVEVLPDRDPADITSLLAAHLVHEVLALDALAGR